MTQCNSPTDHGINLPIQFKFVFNSTVQFLHCTYMYLYITLTPFATLIDHLTWQVFYFEHTLRMRSTSLSSFEAHYSTSARSCLLLKKLFPNIWPRPTYSYLASTPGSCIILCHGGRVIGCCYTIQEGIPFESIPA